MKTKKFELTRESKINDFGVTLFRIRATESFKSIKKGDLGGWIEKIENLSDDAWVSDNAQVYGNSRVLGNAQMDD